MKGQSELTATFVKLIQLGLVIIGALAIFFTYITYEISVYQSSLERNAYLLGDSILSSSYLTDGTKGVFVQSKVSSFDKSRIMYPGKFRISSASFDSGEIELLPKSSYTEFVTFDALIRIGTTLEPAKLEVSV